MKMKLQQCMFLCVLVAIGMMTGCSKPSKAEAAMVRDAEAAAGVKLGEKLNPADVMPHVEGEKFLTDKDPFAGVEFSCYRVKDYKPGSFINFEYCTVNVIPSNQIISSIRFVSYHHCGEFSFNTNLDNTKAEVTRALKLEYGIEPEYITDHTDMARFPGKRYIGSVTYSHNHYNRKRPESFLEWYDDYYEKLEYNVTDTEWSGKFIDEMYAHQEKEEKAKLKAKGFM